MSISAAYAPQSYTGNGSATDYSTVFPFLANADVKVYVGGVLKTITTDYTLTGEGNPAGGTVTFLSAPANAAAVLIKRVTGQIQDLNLVINDAFPPESLEKALDRNIMILQEFEVRLAALEA